MRTPPTGLLIMLGGEPLAQIIHKETPNIFTSAGHGVWHSSLQQGYHSLPFASRHCIHSTCPPPPTPRFLHLALRTRTCVVPKPHDNFPLTTKDLRSCSVTERINTLPCFLLQALHHNTNTFRPSSCIFILHIHSSDRDIRKSCTALHELTSLRLLACSVTQTQTKETGWRN